MPVYVYQCIKCGYKFDYFHRKQNESKPDCENCGHKEVNTLPPRIGMIDMNGKISTSITARKWNEQKEKNKEYNQKMGVDVK